MVLLLHIIIALSGIAYSTYAFFSPSKAKLRASQGLVAGTLVSGTWLVMSSHAAVLQSCLAGLVYTGTVSVILAGAQYRLAKQSA